MKPAFSEPELRYLQPGALYAGRRTLLLRTILGSCVAVTLWHPATGMAAMCHYVLATRPGHQHKAPRDCDGRYGEDALQFLYTAMQSHDPHASHYQIGLFGGATLARHREGFRVGASNISLAEQCLQGWGWRIRQIDIAGHGGRMLQLDTTSGAIHVRYHWPPGEIDDRITTLRERA